MSVRPSFVHSRGNKHSIFDSLGTKGKNTPSAGHVTEGARFPGSNGYFLVLVITKCFSIAVVTENCSYDQKIVLSFTNLPKLL